MIQNCVLLALACGLRTQPSWTTSIQQQPAVQKIIPAPKSEDQLAFKGRMGYCTIM